MPNCSDPCPACLARERLEQYERIAKLREEEQAWRERRRRIVAAIERSALND